MTRIPPQVHAMLVCDQAFQQAETGKWCVIGTHDMVVGTTSPLVHPFAIFLSLGDFESGSRFRIVMRQEDGEAVCQVEAEAGMAQAVGNFDLGVQFPQLQLQEGTYVIELIAVGQVLAKRALHVQLGAPPP